MCVCVCACVVLTLKYELIKLDLKNINSTLG
jgi:hypothetical protein